MRITQPGPSGRALPAGWRRWLLPLTATAGLLTLVALAPGAGQGTALTYSRFQADVSAGLVRAVTIGRPAR